MPVFPADKVFCILYSSGGTADVGRHAVRAALDSSDLKIRVLTRDPKTLLEETNWNSYGEHTFTDQEVDRLDVRTVDIEKDDLKPHLKDVGGVVSALGNRQPYFGDNIANAGTKNLLSAMESEGVGRLVAVTSTGCNEDWPPLEYHFAGKVFKWMLRTVARKGYKDLCEAEKAIFGSTRNYLVVRPVGLGEDRPPTGEWVIQKKKYEHKVGLDMSKLDCARFCVQEVLKPTYEKRAVVIGTDEKPKE